MLAQPPEKYTVGNILRITEGNLSVVSCLEQEPNLCPRQDECMTLYIWQGLNDVIAKYLDSITIQDIVDRESSGDDYAI